MSKDCKTFFLQAAQGQVKLHMGQPSTGCAGCARLPTECMHAWQYLCPAFRAQTVTIAFLGRQTEGKTKRKNLVSLALVAVGMIDRSRHDGADSAGLVVVRYGRIRVARLSGVLVQRIDDEILSFYEVHRQGLGSQNLENVKNRGGKK